jgi:hypothetical protein
MKPLSELIRKVRYPDKSTPSEDVNAAIEADENVASQVEQEVESQPARPKSKPPFPGNRAAPPSPGGTAQSSES